MALNEAFVGRQYPPGPAYEVGREKLREFAAAIGEANRACYERDAAVALGYRDIIAPPTFAFVLAMRANAVAVADPDLGLNYAQVVHGEQSFEYSRPIMAGDELVVTTTIEAIRSAAGNDLLTTKADIATVDGEHVVTARTVIVSRGTAA